MSTEADGYLDEVPQKGLGLEKVKGLSIGAKAVLVCATLLFFSLFLTWQNLEIDYGRTGTGTQMLDGWDTIGLFIGLLTVGLLTLAVVVKLSDVDVSDEIDWELIMLGLAAAIFVLVLAKNVTDRDTAWGGFLAILLSAGVVAGAFLDWSGMVLARSGLRRRRRRRLSGGA